MRQYGIRILFVVILLICGAAAAIQGAALVVRWNDNMTQTARVMPGERALSMPLGSVPRTGGELFYPRDRREAAAARTNPVAATPKSLQEGEQLYTFYCVPCHGASGKGDGLVSAKFVPPPDLTNPELHKVRTDGYWQSYLSVGGAVMPSYGEALTAEERWHVVNYLRTLAKR